MNWLDIVLLVILAYFVVKGAREGFVKLIGGFIGIIVGAWAAGTYYGDVADALLQYINLDFFVAIIVAFIGIFIVINILVGIIVAVIMTIFKIIPLATTANRLVGAVLGVLQGALFIGLIIWVITLFPFENRFSEKLKESRVASAFEYTTQLVQPLLPEGLRTLDITIIQDLQSFSEEQGEYFRSNMPKFFDRIKDRQDRFEQSIEEEIQKDV